VTTLFFNFVSLITLLWNVIERLLENSHIHTCFIYVDADSFIELEKTSQMGFPFKLCWLLQMSFVHVLS